MAWANCICRRRKSYQQYYDTENARWNEHARDCGSKCQGWATERGWQHDLKAHRTEPSSQDQLSSGNIRRSQRRKANKTWCQPRGPVLARNRTIATPTDTQLGLTERRPVTGTHQSDNPAAAIDQRVRSQEPTTLTHSGQQSPNGDVSKPHSSTWNLHHTDVKIQKLTSGNTTPSYTRPTRQATSRANLNGVERRTRVSNVCQVPKPVVTRIGRNSGEVCTVKITSNLTKSNKWTTIKCDWNHKVTKCASYWRSGDAGRTPRSPTECKKLHIYRSSDCSNKLAHTVTGLYSRANPQVLSPNSRQLTIFVVSRFTPIHTPPEVGGLSTNQATEKGDKSGSGRGQLGSRPGQCRHNLQTFCGRWPRSSSVFWQNSNFYIIANNYKSSINTTPILNILSVKFSRIHILSLS